MAKSADTSWARGGKQIYIRPNDKVRFDAHSVGYVESTTVLDSEWHHVAATFEKTSNTVRLYIDGQLEGTKTLSLLPDVSGHLVKIGDKGGGPHFKGNIDEVRIWSTTLDESTIRAWMHRSIDDSHSSYDNLLAYYRFDEGSGTKAGDSTSGWDPGWAHQKDVTISNGGEALTDYQQLVTLDTKALVIAGELQDDCDDLRFTDVPGTEFGHWLESGCNSPTTRVWVKVPSIPAGESHLLLHHGNPSASSASNGAAVFEFFDDFEDGVWTDKWTQLYIGTYGKIEEANGVLKHYSNDKGYQCTSAGFVLKATNTDLGDGLVYELDVVEVTGRSNHKPFLEVAGTGARTTDKDCCQPGYIPSATAYAVHMNHKSLNESPIGTITLNEYVDSTRTTVNAVSGLSLPEFTLRFTYAAPTLAISYSTDSGTTWTQGFTNDTGVARSGAILLGGKACGDHSGSVAYEWIRARRYAAVEPTATVGPAPSGNDGTLTNMDDTDWVASGAPGWTKHPLETDIVEPITVHAADLDGDGDMDAFAGTKLSKTVAWWEQELPFGSALEFDGVDDHVVVPDHTELDITDAITIEAWVYPEKNSGELMIVSKGAWVANDLPYELTAYKGDILFQVFDSSGHQCRMTGYTPNTWHHVAGTYDGAEMKLYVNGGLVNTLAYPGTLPSNDRPLVIGQRSTGGVNFDGLIDEVRIWNKALTQDEINAWMRQKVTSVHPSFDSLVAYYRFDEGGGNKAFDAVGNHHGTLRNMDDADRIVPYWTRHEIDTNFENAYTIRDADIDGDGLADILAAARTSDKVTWWKADLTIAGTGLPEGMLPPVNTTTAPCPEGMARINAHWGSYCIDRALLDSNQVFVDTFNEALDLVRAGDNDGAIAKFQECLAIDPTNANVLTNLAILGYTRCSEGQTDCSGTCADLQTDTDNCGKCGIACSALMAIVKCVSGTCDIDMCKAGYGDCDVTYETGCEIKLVTDGNCGACGTVCTGGKSCLDLSCSCPSVKEDCDGTCVDTQSDPANCGTCANACKDGEVCAAGACTSDCPEGTTACTGACVNLQTDGTHCGKCGNVCPSGQVCANGKCSTECPAGTTTCGTACVDLLTDAGNCGTCGTACPEGRTCLAGNCTCPGGNTECTGACVDILIDANNCGGCGTLCTAANALTGCTSGKCAIASCTEGYGDCDLDTTTGCETALSTSDNCGACGTTCSGGKACVEGACACSSGRIDCEGTCVDIQSNPAHCGACGTTCPEGQVCASGSCSTECPSGSSECEGACVDIATDVENCGTCGTVCSVVGGTAECEAGACAVGTCDTGFGDCDSIIATGCETELGGNNAHCGKCGNACDEGEICDGGECERTTNRGNGELCELPNDCASSNCVNKVCCVAGKSCCTSDADCLENEACDTTRFYCIKMAATPPPDAIAGDELREEAAEQLDQARKLIEELKEKAPDLDTSTIETLLTEAQQKLDANDFSAAYKVALDAVKQAEDERKNVKYAIGQECAADEECKTGNCGNSVCCMAGKVCCTKAGQCDVGESCEIERNYCVPEVKEERPRTGKEMVMDILSSPEQLLTIVAAVVGGVGFGLYQIVSKIQDKKEKKKLEAMQQQWQAQQQQQQQFYGGPGGQWQTPGGYQQQYQQWGQQPGGQQWGPPPGQ